MSSKDSLNIKVIAGSTREGRFSIKAAEWMTEQAQKHSGADVELIDLAEYDLPFFDAPVSPAYKSEPYKNEAVAAFTAKIAQADAYIMVTPEYNHGTSGVLKNALDWVYPEWNNKPVSFVSYGSAGGTRAVEQLRLNAIELQMAPIREAVHFSGNSYMPVLMGQKPAEEMFKDYVDAATRMLDQLIWWTKALKAAR